MSRFNRLFAATLVLFVVDCSWAVPLGRTSPGPTDRTSAAAPQSRFFTVDGVRIHYWVQGSGEPVVLVHAWLSNAESNWIKPGTMAQLANNHHQVVALDLAGYGQSDAPDNPEAYGNAWVEQIYQLLDHLHIPQAHMVGYSMGSLIALKFIVEHPDRALSGLLGGMGYLEAGGKNQRTWMSMPRVQSRGAAELALTAAEVNSVHIPVEIVIGSRDPAMQSYVAPLLSVRSDWPVVKIPGTGHIGTVIAQAFRDEVVRWTAER
jgi:pimeloyl-ACP methyl ester carboxylesterase